MICPKCKKTVGEKDAVCRNCGIALKEPKKRPDFKKLFQKKPKSHGAPLKTVNGKMGAFVQSIKENKLKVTVIASAAVLVIVLLIILIAHLSVGEGEKTALKFAECIGSELNEAENDTGIHMKEDSAFRGVNNALTFDYIRESESKTTIDDIAYPEWAVTVDLDKDNKIEKVTYTDLESLKDDSRGKKKDKYISLDKFDKGAKFNTVSDEINMDPYSITYKNENTTYVYKYYYATDSGDAQPIVLSVTFDEDNKFLYDSVKQVYPENM